MINNKRKFVHCIAAVCLTRMLSFPKDRKKKEEKENISRGCVCGGGGRCGGGEGGEWVGGRSI